MLSVSGMRGIAGESLTPGVAARFARAFGEYLREVRAVERPRVILARDGRAGGEPIRDAAAAGLREAGCDVIDLDVAMTPTVGVAVDHFGVDGGLIATASHNPQQWNGLKPILPVSGGGGTGAGAGAASADAAAWIIERFRTIGLLADASGEAPPRGIGLPPDDARGEADIAPTGQKRGATAPTGQKPGATVTRLHVDKVLRAIGPDAIERIRNRAFPIVVDSVNASGTLGARTLMQQLGCTLTHIGGEETGVFSHTPEPTRENLVGLCEEVRRRGAAAGFAQDPDADRLAIVDERGAYIGEEYTLALGAMALFELGLAEVATGSRPTLCANLSTSRMIDDVAAHHGARVIRTPVGEANVAHAMKTHASNLGGEGNGGVIWPSVACVRDSLSAMALVLSLMARTGRTVSQLVADINALGPNPDGYVIEKRKVDIPSRDAATPAVEAIAAHFANHPGARLDRQDGIRVDFEGAWLHVRPSNTEPIMRLIAEAPTAEGATTLLDEAARAIR